METSSQEMSKPINKSCSRCTKPNNTVFKMCDSCRNIGQAQNAKRTKPKCQATDQQSKRCSRNAVNDTCYCATHSFMRDLTPEQVANVRQCSSCRNYKYWDTTNKICTDCSARGQVTRAQTHNDIVSAPKCKAIVSATSLPCVRPASANGYCGKHQRVFRESQVTGSQRTCGNSIRGCTHVLDVNDSHSYCLECRDKARLQGSARKAAKNASVAMFNAAQPSASASTPTSASASTTTIATSASIPTVATSASIPTVATSASIPTVATSASILLMCKVCKQVAPASTFITSKGAHSQKCGDCLEKQRAKESSRDRTDRDYKAYEARPERKAQKKEWNLHNPEKQPEYCKRHRQNQKDILGLDAYRAKQAEFAVAYRAGHPEVMQRMYAHSRANINYRLYNHKQSAIKNRIPMMLTDTESLAMMIAPCFYCGDLPDTSVNFNGIDRKDSSIGYTPDNTVSACTMCNLMKGNRWNDTEFVSAANHILSYHKFTAEPFQRAELFTNSASTNYPVTKARATDRQIAFQLSPPEFASLKQGPCYICGKRNSNVHSNGIDRVVNNGCYVLYNCKACCSSCNRMKKNWSLKRVITQLVHIYNHNNAVPITAEECDIAFFNAFSELDQIAIQPEDTTHTEKRQQGMASKNHVECTRFLPHASASETSVDLGSTIVEDTQVSDIMTLPVVNTSSSNNAERTPVSNVTSQPSSIVTTPHRAPVLAPSTIRSEHVDTQIIHENTQPNDARIASLNARLEHIKSIPIVNRTADDTAEYERIRKQLYRYAKAPTTPKSSRSSYLPPESTTLSTPERTNLSKRLHDERMRATLGDAEYKRRAAERTAKYRRNTFSQ